REKMVRGEQDLDWGCAEALAFGSLVADDRISIRLAGQDSARGTFSHRHSVIRDQKTAEDYVPLNDLWKKEGDEESGHFESWDSLLSEEAALGFEYGYALAREDALVFWEAQFGDFANGAQIQIDQFVTSGEAKWKQLSGLVMLLPHGYDGQGPEHSSARPERFLGLCSSGNMSICNASTAAQYFHLVRRQGLTERKRPMIVFTPKSLLRDKRAASPVHELDSGRFLELIDDSHVEASKVDRVIFCSGKVYHDLDAHRREAGVEDTAIVRLEQLYPLPKSAITELLERYQPNEVVWCQEEPRNMGFWPFMMQRFRDMNVEARYCGRPESSSPATGSYGRHKAEQEYLLKNAFSASEAVGAGS
ncbi:MAG: 2-oxoglutarate dehydrogenase E1 component, partial [Planctomycetota bacterium]